MKLIILNSNDIRSNEDDTIINNDKIANNDIVINPNDNLKLEMQ